MNLPSFILKIIALVLIPQAVNATESKVKSLLQSMSTEEKVQQMLVFGFGGTDFSSSLGPRLRSMQPGSFIVFKRNIKSPYELSKSIFQAQKLAIERTGLPLIFMVDQEGGQVTRIKTRPSSPSALSMGKTGNIDLIEEIGFTTGMVLQSIGLNMNLAPVLDIADPGKKHFIGNRSFGSQPEAVASYGAAYSMGLIRAGVIPTAKHFPGHGGTLQDSHKVEAQKNDSRKLLEQRDLLPFAEYSKINGTKAMMVAHVSYPALDPSGSPATYSKPIVTDLLRDKLGYSGLIITDDLEMSGAAGIGNVGERAVRAIQAGVDMVMVAWSLKKQKAVKAALIKNIRENRISIDRVNDSVRRVLLAKLKLKKRYSRSFKPSMNDLKENLSRLKELSHKTSYINFESDFKKGKPFLSIDPEATIYVFSGDQRFFKNFEKKTRQATQLFSLRSNKPKDITYRMNANRNAVGVYYATGGITAKRLNELPESVQSRIIVVNTTYPGLIDRPGNFMKVINLSTKDYAAGFWLAESLNKLKVKSRLPTALKFQPNSGKADKSLDYGKEKRKKNSN